MAYLARTLPKRVFTPSLTQSIRQTRSTSTAVLQSTPTTRTTQLTPTNQPRNPLPHRTYHSALHARLPDHSYTNSQTAILTSALAHVPAHGFSATALTLGARDAGFLDVSVEEGGLFRRIAAEKGKDVHELSVEERVRGLLLERLRMNAEVKDVWQDALAQMSLLANIPISLAELHALASDILTLSGDDAVDAAWYTHRLAVSAIYASAEVVMTRDPTPDLVETAAFVERRFEDRKALADKLTGIGQCAGFGWNTAIGLGRSWGLKI
ncbi:uncharacterized protein N7500_002443 [Penicillium coprophilum]|uniref:uncharacterized protein n=1 Tax=Penicillium coprophilum TaxID=36646 RepID=UPI0023988534|nr:uncharacterized protein N7500_002443 [Penicillium coprophilum]KAJ5169660.1 hypothetical protein N7500_002443 [Penicillium coprophilum]